MLMLRSTLLAGVIATVSGVNPKPGVRVTARQPSMSHSRLRSASPPIQQVRRQIQRRSPSEQPPLDPVVAPNSTNNRWNVTGAPVANGFSHQQQWEKADTSKTARQINSQAHVMMFKLLQSGEMEYKGQNVAVMHANIKRYLEEIRRLQSEVAINKADALALETAQAKLENAMGEWNAAKLSAEKYKRDFAEASRQLENEKSLNQLKGQELAAVQQERDEVMARLERKTNALTTKLSELERQNNSLQKSLEDANARVHTLRDALAKANATKPAIENAQGQLDKLKAEIETLKALYQGQVFGWCFMLFLIVAGIAILPMLGIEL